MEEALDLSFDRLLMMMMMMMMMMNVGRLLIGMKYSGSVKGWYGELGGGGVMVFIFRV